MNILRQLLEVLPGALVTGDTSLSIEGITADSRAVKPGWLFVAERGTHRDGHEFIPDAINAGASAILAETTVPNACPVTWIQKAPTRNYLSQLASAFHDDPSSAMKVAGVTGTNGKTTIAFLLRHLCEAAQRRCGLMGTVVFSDGINTKTASHTTPDAVQLQGLLAKMRDNGCRCVAMEVSSHALDQNRTTGVNFDAAVFTNLTQDHLDYHKTMEAYFEAKSLLFSQTADGSKNGKLIINTDDTYGAALAKEHAGYPGLVRYGMGLQNEFRIGAPRYDKGGCQFPLEALGRQFLVRLPLIGKYNVYNAVAALAAAHALDLNLREAVGHLATAPQVPGRLESLSQKTKFRLYVDYAHTPDALENVLRTLRELNPRRLIVVAGCGGNRDRAKRPLMAAACEKLADLVMLTSDNPRDEDPEAILNDMEAGLIRKEHARVVDRREAIQLAIEEAKPHDIILIAGKGHENYQEINGVKHQFDDRVVARQIMQKLDLIP